MDSWVLALAVMPASQVLNRRLITMRRNRAGFHAGPARLPGICGPAPKTTDTAAVKGDK